jgi:hypothetical protein
MGSIQAIATSLLLAFSSNALAVNGSDWSAASSTDRLTEVRRILNNIKSRGCTVKNSPEYFVRQINDFYRDPTTRKMELPKALALIATGVGEDWNC